jgi:chromosomal replication initiation ATPase DnaA
MSIGDQFGGRDHSTALYAIDKIRNLIQNDQQVNLQVTEIRKLLES